MFSSARKALYRRSIVTTLVMLLLGPFLAAWSWQSVNSMFNTPHHWIPVTNPQRQEFEQFVDHFESQALVVISWPGCTIDDPRLAAFEAALLDPDQPRADRNRRLFDRVISGYSSLRQLTSEPIGLSREQAINRLQGVLIGPDRQASCAVIMFTDLGGYERREAIMAILEAAQAECNLEPEAFRLAGPPVDGVAIDQAGVDTMQWFAIPSAIISLILCWLCLRDLRYSLAIFSAAAFGEGLCLALVFWSGQPMNAVLILMPPFVFVLTIAAGVHLVNYYMDEVRLHGQEGATRRAMQIGWLPCTLATVTTGIGLSSLWISDVEPIRRFGAFATIGVATTLLLLFCLLPGLMERWPNVARKQESARPDRWSFLAGTIIRSATFVSVSSIALIIAMAWGLFSLETSLKLRELFWPRDRLLADYDWLEERLGPMVPVEVILHFRADSQLDFLQKIAIVDAVAQTVRRINQVQGVMSAETFTPPIPTGSGVRHVVRRSLISKKLTQEQSRFVAARYLFQGNARQSWRIAARVPALSDVDYEQFLNELKDEVAPVAAQASAKVGEPIEVTVTGAIPLIYQTQRLLLDDMTRSFVTAFAIVGVVLMFVLRSVPAGLVAMIPNVFPAAVVFGLMGWLAIPVDLGSVMTASIALGIAVVDTIHFLTWFRREIANGRERPEAIRRAYRHCATAMLQTSLICGLGMIAFSFSSFVPASRFAWMVLILLMTALIADLVILPALLASPLGRFFVKPPAIQ